MTPRDLENILLQAKPFEPRALVLLRKHQAGEVESISQIDRMRAYKEMQKVASVAGNTTEKLKRLTPQALSNPDSPMVQGFYL